MHKDGAGAGSNLAPSLKSPPWRLAPSPDLLLVEYDDFGREVVFASASILSDALLPGKGERGKNCGKFVKAKVCDNCGFGVPVRSSCTQSLCPSCWHKWRYKRAKAILVKLEGFRRKVFVGRGRNWRVAKFHHVVISPPPGVGYYLLARARSSLKARLMYRLFRKVRGLAVWAGFYDGGVIIFHPFRLKWECPVCGEWFEPKEFEEHLKGHAKEDINVREIVKKFRKREDDPIKEGRKWSKVRRKENWRDYVYFSPHFHVFGVATTIPGEVCRRIYERTGWVVHRITGRGKVSVGNLEELARSVLYCLSHVGILIDEGENGEGKIRTVRYFGELAEFRTKGRDVERDVVEVLLRAQQRLGDAEVVAEGGLDVCPRCGAKLRVVALSSLSEEEVKRIFEEWKKWREENRNNKKWKGKDPPPSPSSSFDGRE